MDLYHAMMYPGKTLQLQQILILLLNNMLFIFLKRAVTNEFPKMVENSLKLIVTSLNCLFVRRTD